jgi:hypothetical protein
VRDEIEKYVLVLRGALQTIEEITRVPTYTRNLKNTLETSGEDVKLHTEPVEKMYNYTRNR